MTTVLVTGADGFIGRNLAVALRRQPGLSVIAYDVGDPCRRLALAAVLPTVDVIVHLAGVNRPPTQEEFRQVNAGFTRTLCDELVLLGRAPAILFASSVQAELDNPYGASKREAEEVLADYAQREGAYVSIYRLTNVFGKWARPNYNSVVATFCHNAAQGLELDVHDPLRELHLCYIDDVVKAFAADATAPHAPGVSRPQACPTYTVTLGRLAETIRSFRSGRDSLVPPNCSDELTRRLYATYLTYVPPADLAYALGQHEDARGTLAEFVRSPSGGQLFLSRTRPGVTRGNHYHDTKTEKFLVVEGDGVIRLRPVLGGDVAEHRVAGRDLRVVDIPPGYAHSIENVGDGDMVVLFWSDTAFDQDQPDTYPREVLS